MSDGADDLENNHGSWPMQNIQMANSLKLRDYDFHFRFGTAAHGGAQAATRSAGIAHLAVARLRPEEDLAGIHDGPRGKREALLPRDHHQSRRLVIASEA